MRFEDGFSWLETLIPYISLAEFPRLHEFIRSEHFEAVLGPETLKELDYLTLGVLRHSGRTEEEVVAAGNLRDHYYLRDSYGQY